MHLPGSLEGGQFPQASGVMENPSWLWAAALPVSTVAVQAGAQCDHAASLPDCYSGTIMSVSVCVTFVYSCPFSLAHKPSFPSLLGESVKCLTPFG